MPLVGASLGAASGTLSGYLTDIGIDEILRHISGDWPLSLGSVVGYNVWAPMRSVFSQSMKIRTYWRLK
jgi:hypothetical protein